MFDYIRYVRCFKKLIISVLFCFVLKIVLYIFSWENSPCKKCFIDQVSVEYSRMLAQHSAGIIIEMLIITKIIIDIVLTT